MARSFLMSAESPKRGWRLGPFRQNWLRFAKIAPRGAMHSNFPSLGYNILSGEMPIAFASAGLPARFVLISGAMLPQILLNVPLTTTLLTHGAAVLFLLWYVKQIEN
jgi:hypothetical protein